MKGQILRLRPARPGAPCSSGRSGASSQGSSVYLVPRDDGTVVVGATVEERGFDTTVTAGAVYELLRDARRVVPGVTELELVEVAHGAAPRLARQRPHRRGHGPVDGLVVATGHYRNGILLTPLTAEAVAAMVNGEEPPRRDGTFGPGALRPRPTPGDGPAVTDTNGRSAGTETTARRPGRTPAARRPRRNSVSR